MRKFLSWRNIFILGVILVVGGGIIRSRFKASQEIKNQEIVGVTKGEVLRTLVVSGRVVAKHQATLNFPSPGKLGYISVEEGQSVFRGQALAGLNLGDLRAAESAAYYRYQAADANAKEVEDSVKGHDGDETFAQKNDRVSAQTARDIAYDAWLTAKRALTNANLFAPFDGVVTEVSATAVGDTVGIADGISLVDPSSLYFEIEIDESDLGLVQNGMPVTVVLDAFEDKEFAGTISTIGFVSQLSDAGATVYVARVDLTGWPVELRIGMNGDAKMTLERKENVLTLPVESVTDGKVVLPGAKGEEKEVEVGLEGDDTVEIVSGLNEGDQVVR